MRDICMVQALDKAKGIPESERRSMAYIEVVEAEQRCPFPARACSHSLFFMVVKRQIVGQIVYFTKYSPERS
jgi:hypothetical protein